MAKEVPYMDGMHVRFLGGNLRAIHSDAENWLESRAETPLGESPCGGRWFPEPSAMTLPPGASSPEKAVFCNYLFVNTTGHVCLFSTLPSLSRP